MKIIRFIFLFNFPIIYVQEQFFTSTLIKGFFIFILVKEFLSFSNEFWEIFFSMFVCEPLFFSIPIQKPFFIFRPIRELFSSKQSLSISTFFQWFFLLSTKKSIANFHINI